MAVGLTASTPLTLGKHTAAGHPGQWPDGRDPRVKLTRCSRHFVASSNRLRSPGEQRRHSELPVLRAAAPLRLPSALCPPSDVTGVPECLLCRDPQFSETIHALADHTEHTVRASDSSVGLVRSRPAVLAKKPTETVNIYVHGPVAVLLGDALYTDGYRQLSHSIKQAVTNVFSCLMFSCYTDRMNSGEDQPHTRTVREDPIVCCHPLQRPSSPLLNT